MTKIKIVKEYNEKGQVICATKYGGCGEVLTSPRSIRFGMGQRCRWANFGRPQRKRSHLMKSPWVVSGGKGYQRYRQSALTEF